MSSVATNEEAIREIVVLDVDDTLYLESDYVASGFRAVAAQVAREVGCVDFADRALRVFASGIRTRVFNTVLEEHGGAAPADLIARLITAYREHKPAIMLAPDAERFIARQRTGRALAIISDGFLVAQQAKIRALGLDHGRFKHIILTDEFGRDGWKPNERAFRQIQAQFKQPAHCFIYVADNPAKDFVAPRKLGWKTARVRRKYGLHRDATCHPPADVEIENLDELTDFLLEQLLRHDQGSGNRGSFKF